VYVHLNLKGDPLRLHYTSTLTDTNNVYGDNVGKKVVDEKSQEKKSQEKSHRKKIHIYNVIFQIIKVFCKNYFNALIFNLFIL
jgi:hypothetical protein